ncbi:hypothetical protein BJ878DRAFT_506863 [Calycina marina]|uniref:Uncharacterized protein n=1 Tax=Calycina marina TaxID=1763456 RepID=A0A9P8CF27_9HELO|nr:hypothetical protein BJ878DRAFT_506863 [Calycina marina]
MLLNIRQPTTQLYKSLHEYTPPTPPATSRFSPVIPFTSAGQKTLPPVSSTGSVTDSVTEQMSTHHRGLPPPPGLALPHTQQSLPQSSQQLQNPAQPPLSQPMGQLPAPPQQWQGTEESMRNWLHAKAEEDKRKQEEEKTRQETLRLEQRKIEQEILRASLNGGIPPYMIPMVFAGMGAGNLPHASLDWAQHYMAQAQQLQPPQPQPLLASSQNQQSPEHLLNRDFHAGPQSFGQQQATVTLSSTPVGGPVQQSGTGFPAGLQDSPSSKIRQIAQAKISGQTQATQLPRLNTGEMHIQGPPNGPQMQIIPGQPGHPLQQSQTVRQQEHPSPSIYFHHWQPPMSQVSTSSGAQPTPLTEQTNSPKKRKATGPQQAPPPPTSQPQYTSPSYSQPGSSVSNTPQSQRRGHSRQRSDMSPEGRQQHLESNYATQDPEGLPEASRPGPSEPPRRSGHSVSSLLGQSSDTRPQQHQHHTAEQESRHDEPRQLSPEEDSRRTKMIKRDGSRN